MLGLFALRVTPNPSHYSWPNLHTREKVVRSWRIDSSGFNRDTGCWRSSEREIKRRNSVTKEPSGAAKMFGDFAPKLVQLTDDVLFGDVWERKDLPKRDRSLITVAALVALNRPDQLRFHLGNAIKNGVKEQELIEVITHLAFYSGWPNAMTAMSIAKELFSKS